MATRAVTPASAASERCVERPVRSGRKKARKARAFSLNKIVVVAREDDDEAILNHALIQSRRRYRT